MGRNIAIFVCLAALTYAVTLYFDHAPPPAHDVIVQPETVIVPVEHGAAVPEFSFKTPDGKAHKISDFKGRIIILNFWASWCPPCVKEFPALLEVAQKFPKDVVLVALSSDLDEDAMKRFLKKHHGEKLPENVFVALDGDQSITQKLFQTYRLPETVLIDKAQIMRNKIAGADWSVKELAAQIKTLSP